MSENVSGSSLPLRFWPVLIENGSYVEYSLSGKASEQQLTDYLREKREGDANLKAVSNTLQNFFQDFIEKKKQLKELYQCKEIRISSNYLVLNNVIGEIEKKPNGLNFKPENILPSVEWHVKYLRKEKGIYTQKVSRDPYALIGTKR